MVNILPPAYTCKRSVMCWDVASHLSRHFETARRELHTPVYEIQFLTLKQESLGIFYFDVILFRQSKTKRVASINLF